MQQKFFLTCASGMGLIMAGALCVQVAVGGGFDPAHAASHTPCTPAGVQAAEDCATPDPAKPVKRLLEGVNFDKDQAELRPDAVATLERAAENLKAWGDIKLEVAGHTDRKGSAAHNRDLSQRRANAVRAYLIDRGVAAGRLTAKGYGGSSPVAGNATVADRAKNRRVELVPIR